MIKNLVLSGGSSKGYTYLGVLKAFTEEQFPSIENFVGTSIGSIFASLFAMNFTYNNLMEFIHIPVEIKDLNIEYLFDNFGFCSGDELICHFCNIIKTRYDIDITFEDLYKITKNNLIICVLNINTKKIEYISKDTYPSMKIIDAIRYAITIPFVFTCKKYNDEYMFVDASVMENISFNGYKPKETLGILLKGNKPVVKIDSLESYTMRIIDCLKHSHNKYDKKYRVLEIKCDNINTLDFSLPKDKIEYLIDNGYKNTLNFLKKNN